MAITIDIIYAITLFLIARDRPLNIIWTRRGTRGTKLEAM